MRLEFEAQAGVDTAQGRLSLQRRLVDAGGVASATTRGGQQSRCGDDGDAPQDAVSQEGGHPGTWVRRNSNRYDAMYWLLVSSTLKLVAVPVTQSSYSAAV